MSKDTDRNLISFTGDPAGNIWRNGLILFRAEAWDGQTPRQHREGPIVPPAGHVYDDVLKFSGVRGLHLEVLGPVPGGTEDCIDFNNRCEGVTVRSPDGLHPRGLYALTVKGGSRSIAVEAPLRAHAREVDVDLGNHSDQSKRVTRGVTLKLSAVDGQPITYRQLNATTPHLAGPGPWVCKFRLRGMWRHPFAELYALLKRFLPI